jgi:RNA polymerase sigma-70 factor (ECF subfamily)
MIEGCRTGDNSARKAFYDLYSKRMLAVCYRYTGDEDAAHDVLHDGFIKIFTRFNFRGECSLDTWVARIMVNQCLDYLRRNKRINGVISSEELPDLPDEAEADAALMGGQLSNEVLRELVTGLPDGCREVFNLFVFEEKSHKEIAALLGIKEHSSTSQLHRAKHMLMKKIKDYRLNEERL